MAMNVYVNNQPPPSPAVIAVHSNQWSTGICDCFDDLGCFAYWCFPCFACNTASEFGECLCLPLLDMLGFAFSPTPPVSMSMRVAVRHRYGIQGDMAGDCVYATFCNVCSWCQMAREIKRRKETRNVITAQPMYTGGQQYMVASQPVIANAPPAILTSTLM